MSLDIVAIVLGAVDAAGDSVKNAAPQVKEILGKLAKGHDKAILSLTEMFAEGEIDEDTFKDEMADEAKVLEAELLVLSVVTKAIAQRAINAFRKALIDGVTSAIKAAI
jgi:hypothetical protein